ncbi:ORF2 [Torque teno Tadarida brasiliensis virus 3]|nr:ORF2 [Torque teno Tadarida brasiliensis virus 3]
MATDEVSETTPPTPKTVDTRFKLHEAFWKQMVSRTHSLFCNCGQFLKHFRGWQDTGEKDGGDPDTENGDVRVNFDLGFIDAEEDALDAAIRYELSVNGELART